MLVELHSCSLIYALHFILGFQVVCFLGCFNDLLLSATAMLFSSIHQLSNASAPPSS
jgi:hypothetical protein